MSESPECSQEIKKKCSACETVADIVTCDECKKEVCDECYDFEYQMCYLCSRIMNEKEGYPF